MKAILLAGGQGERLWPVCAGEPKYMAPVLGRPLLDRAAAQLARAGVTELMVTLRAGDRAAADCLGEGAAHGLKLCYQEEREPLGTAGAVAACAGFVGGEDFLVVCGDVVWDFDLTPALALHRAQRAAATLTLAHSATPERYGAAACDQMGRVVYFEEKPPLARCESLTVSTGVTVCSPEIFADLEAGEDLARDLFPKLLGRGTLWGTAVEGYWRDVGTPEDLLLCAAELLSGRGAQDLEPAGGRPGIYSAGPLPEGVDFVPPCWLGPGVSVGSGSLVGPHAILEEGTVIGPRSLVQRSLVDGAELGGRATLYGAVVCRGARAGSYCVLNEGSVVGPAAELGDNVVLMEGAQVAPETQVPSATRLDAGRTARPGGQIPAFGRTEEEGKKSLYFL